MEKESAGNKNRACSPRGDEHLISLSEFLQRLDVSENGLSEQEAARRLKECGPNVLEEAGKENIFKRYVRQFRNFFSILLTVGAILSFLGEYLDPGRGIFISELPSSGSSSLTELSRLCRNTRLRRQWKAFGSFFRPMPGF